MDETIIKTDPFAGFQPPRFAVGDRIWLAETESKKKQRPCPDCLDTREWSVTTPGGSTLKAKCLRCSRSFSNLPSLDYWEHDPTVRSVRVDGTVVRTENADFHRPAVEYTINRTPHSCRTLQDSEAFATEDAAMAAATALAARRNTEQGHDIQKMSTAGLAELTLVDAVIDDAWKTSFHGMYSYTRLVEDLQMIVAEVNGEDGTTLSVDQMTERLEETLRSEADYRDAPPVAQLMQKLGDLFTLRDAVVSADDEPTAQNRVITLLGAVDAIRTSCGDVANAVSMAIETSRRARAAEAAS